jgi:hypothetical protein
LEGSLKGSCSRDSGEISVRSSIGKAALGTRVRSDADPENRSWLFPGGCCRVRARLLFQKCRIHVNPVICWRFIIVQRCIASYTAGCATGDVAYVQQTLAHYIENTQTEDLRFLGSVALRMVVAHSGKTADVEFAVLSVQGSWNSVVLQLSTMRFARL